MSSLCICGLAVSGESVCIACLSSHHWLSTTLRGMGQMKKKDVDNILFQNRKSYGFCTILLFQFTGTTSEAKVRLTNCSSTIYMLYLGFSKSVSPFSPNNFLLYPSSLRFQIPNNCPLNIIFLLFPSPLRLTNKNSKSDSCSAISGFTCVTST